MKTENIDITVLRNALVTLKEGLSPKTQLEKDGTIQRFEYTFELCWKFMRRFLLSMGRGEVSNSPKPLIRDAFQEGWIKDTGPWFEFLEMRNKTAHSYDKKIAEEIFDSALKFPKYVDELISSFEKIKVN